MRTTLEIDDELLKSLLARHPGATKREIACVRAEATLWTRDRDFERVKDVLHGLQLHSS